MPDSNSTDEQRAFSQEVAQRFGLVPNFFVSARDAPKVTAKLWQFAEAAYLDTPIPSLFKERLFVYLSRFCAVRYCITRHCAFLLGYGHAAGDPAARAQTVVQAIQLLRTLPPWRREFDVVLDGLDSVPMPGSWPEPDSQLEDWIFAAATVVFVEPARSERARRAPRGVGTADPGDLRGPGRRVQRVPRYRHGVPAVRVAARARGLGRVP